MEHGQLTGFDAALPCDVATVGQLAGSLLRVNFQ